MSVTRLCSECITCLLSKHLSFCTENATNAQKTEYMQKVCSAIANAKPQDSGPSLLYMIDKAKREVFGVSDDYSEIKSHFNKLMLGYKDACLEKINTAKDPLRQSILYAIIGNLIDFAAFKTVDEKELYKTLCNAESLSVDMSTLDAFKKDLENAKNLVYLTDNCGEIVMDMLNIQTIKKLYPHLDITVIVKGAPAINDATMEDAIETGLDKIVNVTGNGAAIVGSDLELISEQSKNIIDSADVIISKGQANFETLCYCGKNIYYLFLCKCELFAKKLNVPFMSAMFINEKEL